MPRNQVTANELKTRVERIKNELYHLPLHLKSWKPTVSLKTDSKRNPRKGNLSSIFQRKNPKLNTVKFEERRTSVGKLTLQTKCLQIPVPDDLSLGKKPGIFERKSNSSGNLLREPGVRSGHRGMCKDITKVLKRIQCSLIDSRKAQPRRPEAIRELFNQENSFYRTQFPKFMMKRKSSLGINKSFLR